MRKAFLLLLLPLFLAPQASAKPATSWGVDRIDQESLPLDGLYRGSGDGAGVHIYVVGSGIASLSEWTLGAGYGPSGDCGGSATAAAATAAGATRGIAPAATLHSVRVDNCSGISPDLKEGLDWILANASSNSVVLVLPSVPLSAAANTSAAALRQAGHVVVAAAGDEAWNACTRSPSGESSVLSVGSSTPSDAISSFSNTGSCVDIWAPGEDIPSFGPLGGATEVSSTEQSAAFVAGVAALHLQRGRTAAPEQILASATKRAGSSDRLLFLGDLLEGEAARYGPPALSEPPSVASSSPAVWNFTGGLYADGNRSGSWLANVLWDGEAFQTELRCILRTEGGQEVLNIRVAGSADPEPSSCSLDLSNVAEGRYVFAVRKDLVSNTRRIPGYEALAPVEVDLRGPEATWIAPFPGASSRVTMSYNLQITDRSAISGIAGSDFRSLGTATGCFFLPAASTLGAGGGTVRVDVSCSGDGTVIPELRAGTLLSNGRTGPTLSVAGPAATFDRVPPQTTVLERPASTTRSPEARFVFSASEPSSFVCSLNGENDTPCTSPWTISSLQPGYYTAEIRATDSAGNEEAATQLYSWTVLDPLPARPANDRFADARELGGSFSGTTKNATKEKNEPAHGEGAWKSVWFQWTAPDDGDLDIDTKGSRIDTLIALYSSSAGLSSLRLVSKSDDYQGWPWSRVSASVKAGETYYLALAGTYGSEGAYKIQSRFYPKGKLPPASQIVSVQRKRAQREVHIELGTRGEGAPYYMECRLLPNKWKRCSERHVLRGLRKGRDYVFQVRTVSQEGLAELRPKQLRFRL